MSVALMISCTCTPTVELTRLMLVMWLATHLQPTTIWWPNDEMVAGWRRVARHITSMSGVSYTVGVQPTIWPPSLDSVARTSGQEADHALLPIVIMCVDATTHISKAQNGAEICNDPLVMILKSLCCMQALSSVWTSSSGGLPCYGRYWGQNIMQGVLEYFILVSWK